MPRKYTRTLLIGWSYHGTRAKAKDTMANSAKATMLARMISDRSLGCVRSIIGDRVE
ncbi:MAG: hypothetical protein IPI91_06915 [Flavobacteriales bacterium]|nr:hypothetical protein [Flavobacteriales bacterium]